MRSADGFGRSLTDVVVVTPEEVLAGAAGAAAMAVGADAAAGSARVVVVAGPDAEAVGRAVAVLSERGGATRMAGFVGDPSDPALAEMIAELFPAP